MSGICKIVSLQCVLTLLLSIQVKSHHQFIITPGFVYVVILYFKWFVKGIKGGICALVEKAFGKKLLHLACRHHIFELVLRAVVEHYWPTTRGPEVPIFKRFQQSWDTIDKKRFVNGLEDPYVSQIVTEEQAKILDFISHRFEVLLLRSLLSLIINDVFFFIFHIVIGFFFKSFRKLNQETIIANFWSWRLFF